MLALVICILKVFGDVIINSRLSSRRKIAFLWRLEFKDIDRILHNKGFYSNNY